MEEEARRILKAALGDTRASVRLGSQLHARFRGVADEAFALLERKLPRKPPQWDEGA